MSCLSSHIFFLREKTYSPRAQLLYAGEQAGEVGRGSPFLLPLLRMPSFPLLTMFSEVESGQWTKVNLDKLVFEFHQQTGSMQNFKLGGT